MALEDIVKGIKEKVSQEVEKIRQEADKEREEIIRRAKEKANKVKDEILKRVEEEGESERQRKLMRTRSEERKKTLALKRELMNEVFRQAKEILDNLSEEEYLNWLKRFLISNIDSGSEEIIISSRDRRLMEGNFAEKLKFFPELDEKERGFIIRKEGIQINYTFSSLFSSLKDELEVEIARRLFSF